MTKPTAVGIAAREACEKFPQTDSRTLARMLAKDRPKLFPTIERARCAVRAIRGNHGKKSRTEATDKTLFRPPGRAGQVTMPEFIEEPWKASAVIDGPATVLVLCDLHVPYTSRSALETAIDFAKKKHRPDVIVLNGDVFDFHRGSRFDHDPNSLEMTDEIPMGVQLMRLLKEKFPKARMIFKEGNHDERWSKWLAIRGSMELANIQGLRLQGMLAREHDRATNKADGQKTESLKPYGWEYITDRHYVKAGRLPIMHGHELGIKSSLQPARAAFLKLSHPVLIGHLHKTHTFPNHNAIAGELATFSVGCLSGLTPFWCRAGSFNHGFAVVEVYLDGEYNVHNYRIADGKVRAS